MPAKYELDLIASKSALTMEYQDDKIVSAIILSGHLNEKVFKEACQYAYTEHPNLRCSLYKQNDRYYLIDDVAFDEVVINNKPVNVINTTTVCEYVTASFSIFTTKALWAVKIFTAADQKIAILFEFHHAIADGIAIAALTDQILEYYSQIQHKLNTTINYLPNSTYTNSVAIKSSLQLAEYMQQVSHSLYDETGSLPKDAYFEQRQPVAIEQRKTKMLLVALPIEPISQLSKKLGVSVNSLLTTYCILAMHEQKKKSQIDSDFLISTCVDLRKFSYPLSPLHVACLYNAVMNRFKIADLGAGNFEQLVLIIHKALKESIAKFSLPPALPAGAAEEVKAAFDIARQAKADNLTFPSAMALSNLGRLPIKLTYSNSNNKLDVSAYFLFVSQRLGFAEILPNMATHANNLYINFTYIWPLHNDHWAIEYVSNFLLKMLNTIPELQLISEWTSNEIIPVFNKNKPKMLSSSSFFHNKKTALPANVNTNKDKMNLALQ